MNQSLMQSQKVVDQEQKLKSKAKNLKEQLEAARKKKQQQAQKQIKQNMITHYQTSFTNYKCEMQEYIQSQIASLQLVKQFKMNQISEFKKCVQDSLNKLGKNLKQSDQYQQSIKNKKLEALKYLKTQKQKQIQEAIQAIKDQKEQKINQYQKSANITDSLRKQLCLILMQQYNQPPYVQWFVFNYQIVMGVYLSQPNTNKQTIVNSKDNVSFCSVQMQGWRKAMEDACIHELDIGDGNALFAVFDGHGGFEVSQCVKQIFVGILKETPEYAKKNFVNALDVTFRKVDEFLCSPQGNKKLKEIRNKGASTQNMYDDRISNGTGCTANVILMTSDKYYIANAGDSRSALMRGNTCINLSQDHKPQSPQEQRRIHKAGGVITMGRVNGGLNLTRSFGDFDYKGNKNLGYDEQMITCKPDIKQFARDPSDRFILLGCDGIWERYVQNSQGLLDEVNKNINKKEKKKLMQDLLDFLLAKDTRQGLGCDNMSAILITFK